MNLKRAFRRNIGRRKDIDLHITPVMNVFVILVPFLFLTAAFVKIAVVDLSLPTVGHRARQEIPDKEVVVTILTVKENGFLVRSSQDKYPQIKKLGVRYDYKSLSEVLKEIKSKYPHVEDIIVSPGPRIKYEVIIKVMDTCRESGFPNISISG